MLQASRANILQNTQAFFMTAEATDDDDDDFTFLHSEHSDRKGRKMASSGN
jgi:hypothetical protein